MAWVNDLHTLLNDTSSEIVGLQGITVKDTASFISLGNAVLSTDTNLEDFYKTLFKVIGRTRVEAVKLRKKSGLDIAWDTMDFGGALRVITTSKIARTRESQSYKNDGKNNPFGYVDTTAIAQNIFETRGTFDIDTKVVLKTQLSQAFHSEREMYEFMSLIYNDIDNGFTLAERDLEHLTYSTMIASALSSTHKEQKRNLLAEYNTLTNKSLTETSCMMDKDFLIYSSREINTAIKYMTELSTVYNTAGYEIETPIEDLRVKMHTLFASACAFYSESSTFHDMLIKLPEYSEVAYWQANDGTFETTSSIKINNGDVNVEKSGIVCVVADKRACATTYKNTRMGSMYDADSERTFYYPKEDYAAIVQRFLPCVVFYIGEDIDTVNVTVTSDNGAFVLPERLNITKGTDANIEVTLDDGKTLDYVTVNGAVVSDAQLEEGTYTLEAVNTDSTVYIATKDA